MQPLRAVTLEDIRAARRNLESTVLRTPLVRLNVEDAPADIYLKLENLQPVGSFKLRGATNALATADAGSLANGVYTASAGNMAQGVAYAARRRGVACSVVVPDNAPLTKRQAIERLGAGIIPVPYDMWWRVMLKHRYAGTEARFVHPVCDPAVIAGNDTIGLEIFEDLPDVAAVVVPFGGGGLSSGIATAVKALKPGTRVFAAEVETAAPLAASLAKGRPETIDHVPSFVDGIGGKSVLPQMWPLVRGLLDAALVVSLRDVAGAIKLLIERNRVVAEGAGAAAVAAALTGEAGRSKIVCVVSGGNIDVAVLAEILHGRTP